MADTTKLNQQQIDIDIAEDDEIKSRVFKFRQKVDPVINNSDTDNENLQHVTDELDKTAQLIYAESGGNIVASFRLNFADDASPGEVMAENYGMELFREFPLSKVSYTSKLLVDPNWRNTTILGKILDASYRMMRIKKISFDFCDCAPSLVQFYEHLGYRRYKLNFVDDKYGYRVPLVLITEDLKHLHSVRSPFLKCAESFSNSPETTDWFKNKFPSYFGLASERLMPMDDFWSFLANRLNQDSVPLLNDLSREEVQKFLTTGIVLKVKKGDKIVRMGDVGNEMFVILSGSVDVRGKVDEKDCSLTIFGKGEIFGEMAFLGQSKRSADVIALEDMEILVLTQAFLRKAMKMIPETAGKILFNLSLILCERLRSNTVNLVERLTAADQ